MGALGIIFLLVGLANASPLYEKGIHSGRGDEEIYMTTVIPNIIDFVILKNN